MRFHRTAIDGLTVVEWEVHSDERGGFCRIFCEEAFAAAGIAFRIVQASLSFNPHLHTLRGMHFQQAPHGEPKIVLCPRGRIFDVAVDVRPDSPTYLRWAAVELAPDLGRMAVLAEGLAHGFLTLEPRSEVQYLMAAPYVPSAARGVRWDDPGIGIEWPAQPAVMADRDRGFPLVGAEPSRTP